MQSHGMVDDEKGLVVRRPKIERIRGLFVWCFISIICILGVFISLFVRKDTLLETVLAVAIFVILGGIVSQFYLDELGRQTFIINQKGITRLRYGQPWKYFEWASFVAIERHVVYRELHYSREKYEAILCSTHPIEIKVQPNGERYLTSEYHRQKSNKDSVVELVLEKDQYAEFLSYIPKEIQKSGIVKI